MSEKKHWPPKLGEKPLRDIVDIVHGSIRVFYPVSYLIDTPEFQRLRYLKQVGLASYVFPSSVHNRFSHSLGVYHLSLLAVKKLSRFHEFDITSNDRLCIAIAGLCHDLGHGPFSHSFERFLSVLNNNVTWKHELGSVLIFRRICQYDWVRNALLEYLNESDLVFIEELIFPPKDKFNENGEWICKGRGAEKSFLYDIVSNSVDSFDVDKFDYLLRDSLHSSIAIPFNMNSVKRILEWMRPIFVNEEYNGLTRRYSRICYAHKVITDLNNASQSRCNLFDQLYCHPTVLACEEMVVRVLKEASGKLVFSGSSGNYPLSKIYQDIDAYLQLDDGIIKMILYSKTSDLETARRLLTDLEFRRLPKHVGSIEHKSCKQQTEDEIRHKMIELVDKSIVHEDDFIVTVNNIDRGMGVNNIPILNIRLYNHKLDPGQTFYYCVNSNWLSGKSPLVGGTTRISFFATYDAIVHKEGVVDAILKAMKKLANFYGSWLAPPNNVG